MEKPKKEKIKFLKDWISKNGPTENLEKLLHGLEHENILRVDLIPAEVFHELYGSNVSAILPSDVLKYQKAYPGYDYPSLRERGLNVLRYGKPVLDLEVAP